MPITNSDRVLAALPYTINTYGQGPGTTGNPVGNSQPIKLDRFEPTPDSGFQANFYKDPVSGKYTVAFAGTNDGPLGPDALNSDRVLATANVLASAGMGTWDPQFTDAIRFTAEAFQQIQKEYIARGDAPPPLDKMRDMVQVVGHSLGGSLAELSAKFFGLRGANVDGPGVQTLVGQTHWNDLKTEVGSQLQGLQTDYQVNSEMFGAYSYTVVGVAGTHLDGIEWQRTPAADAALVSMFTAAGSGATLNMPGVILSAVVAGATAVNHPGASILRETEIAAGLNPDAPRLQSPFTTLLYGGAFQGMHGEGPTINNIRLATEQQQLQSNVANGLSPTGLTIGQTTVQGPFSITVFVDEQTGHLFEIRQPVDAQGQALGDPIRTEYVLDPQGHVGLVDANGSATFIVSAGNGLAAVVTLGADGVMRGQTAYGDQGEMRLDPETTQNIFSGRQGMQQVLDERADAFGEALDIAQGQTPQSQDTVAGLDIDTPPTPGEGILIADAGQGTMTDGGLINGYGDGPTSPVVEPDPAQTPPAPALSSIFGADQLQALQQGLQSSGLDVNNLQAYRQSDGSHLVTNEEGDIVGTVTEGYGSTSVLTTLDGQEVITDGLGQQWSREELSQAQQINAGLNLISSLANGVLNWGELNDGQRLNTLTDLYNQFDGLNSGALPGNIGNQAGALSGVLSLVSGIENYNALQAFSGGIQLGNAVGGMLGNGQVVSQAIADSALGQSLGVSAGQVVPVLNLIIALDNIEDNPWGAVAAAVAFIPVYGQILALAINIVAMFVESDIDPSIGEADVHIDASGAVVVGTTQDEEGGGSTVAQWAQRLGELAVGAGMSAPQAGATAQHLPSVGYYFDPDGVNLSNSAGHLTLRWTDANGQAHQRLYDSSGMRWDGNSVEGQSDIMRDYLLLCQSLEPNWPPVMYQEVAGGILRLDYGVATVLYATALGTYDGQAAHTQGGDEDTDGGEVLIDANSGQMVSLGGRTIENSTGKQTQQTLGAQDIQTVPRTGASASGPQIPFERDPIILTHFEKYITPIAVRSDRFFSIKRSTGKHDRMQFSTSMELIRNP